MSKKKLLYLIPTAVFFFAAGVSLLLANSGHFKLLADALHIGADETITPSNPIQCTVTNAGDASYNGTYEHIGAYNGRFLYQNATGRYLHWNMGSSWYLTDVLDKPPAYHSSVSRIDQPATENVNLPANPWMVTMGPEPAPALTCGVSAGVFSVTGFVKEQITNVLIQGASVNIAGKTATTDTDGGFTISNIPLTSASPSAYPVSVSKTDYNALAASLASYMLGSGITADQTYGIAIIYLTSNTSPSPTIDNTKFNLRGQVLKEADNTPLADVTINIYKPGSTTPDWTTKSTATLTQFQSGAGTNVKYNYEVKDIYNIQQPISEITNLKMEFVKDGYTLGQYLLDNAWKTYNPTINIPLIDKTDQTKMQTYIYTDGNVNKNLALQDVKMTPTSLPLQTLFVMGKITDKDNRRLLSRVTVKISERSGLTHSNWTVKSVNVLQEDLPGSTPHNYAVASLLYNPTVFPLKVEFTRNGYTPVSVTIPDTYPSSKLINGTMFMTKNIAMESNCPIK